MAFQNIRMTDEERAWEQTLGMKDPTLNYKRDLGGRPNGPYMTADRERKMYLFGIMSDNGREPPTKDTLYYFCFIWDGGCLYFTANQIIQYDIKRNYTGFLWEIRSMDLLENKQGLSREQIQALVSEALAKYGRNGLSSNDPSAPEIPGLADFSKATLSEKQDEAYVSESVCK